MPNAAVAPGTVRMAGPLGMPARRYALGVALLVALYYAAAHLGYALGFSGSVAAIIWLPVGVGIAFLYLGGLSYWPGVVVGDLLVNNYTTLPVGSAIGQSCGNLLEVMVGAELIRRLVPDGQPLRNVGSLSRLLFALAAGTFLSATIGLLSARLGGVVTTDALPKLWRTWWLGDFCGALVVVPLVLAWRHPPPREWVKARWVEGLLVIAAVVGLSELATRTTRPVAYLVFPALILAAVRFGARGATVAVAIAAGHALLATTHDIGPFAYHSISHAIFATQLYMAVAAISSLSLAVLVSERDDYAERLQASRARLVTTADAERRRIEHNLHDGAQQRLTALAVYLGIAAEEASVLPEHSPALFERAERDLLVAIDELRALSHGMQPRLLRQDGLAAAMKNVAAASTLPVELLEVPSDRFDPVAEGTAYFVMAEALTNAQKHAQASTVRVRVAALGDSLAVQVVDDGVGGASEGAGVGLQGLRDRVEALGGTLVVESPAGEGTRVAAVIPATPRVTITQSG